MGILQAIVLGAVQGITEFLPISSDGHLILVPSLLGWQRFGLGFDVLLHVGTLFATVVYFRHDVLRLLRSAFSGKEQQPGDRRMIGLIIVATVLSGAVALAIDPFVEGVADLSMQRQVAIAALGLLGTTAFLVVSEVLAVMRRRGSSQHTPGGTPKVDSAKMGWVALTLIAVAQGLAALPGVSRSGTTIATGQATGLTREEAAHFSFLISMPIIVVAIAKKLVDALQQPGVFPDPLTSLVGVVVTALVGFVALTVLIPFVKRHSLLWFAAYTGTAGILLLTVYGSALRV